MRLDINVLGFDDIELDDDELADGAILLVRTQMSGDRVKMVSRAVGGDLFVHRGMLEAALRWSNRTIDGMEKVDHDDEDGL